MVTDTHPLAMKSREVFFDQLFCHNTRVTYVRTIVELLELFSEYRNGRAAAEQPTFQAEGLDAARQPTKQAEELDAARQQTNEAEELIIPGWMHASTGGDEVKLRVVAFKNDDDYDEEDIPERDPHPTRAVPSQDVEVDQPEPVSDDDAKAIARATGKFTLVIGVTEIWELLLPCLSRTDRMAVQKTSRAMFQQVENHTMKVMPGRKGRMSCTRAFVRYDEESGSPEIRYYNAAFCDLYASRAVVTIVGAEIKSKKDMAQALFAAAYARPTTTHDIPVFKLEIIDCVIFDWETLSRLRELFPNLLAVEIHGCPMFPYHGKHHGFHADDTRRYTAPRPMERVQFSQKRLRTVCSDPLAGVSDSVACVIIARSQSSPTKTIA